LAAFIDFHSFILQHQKRYKPFYESKFSTFIEMLNFITSHRIRPVADSAHALPDIVKAFDRLTSGQQFGNVSISISP